MRLAVGNGLRPQLWKEFQSRFGIKQIGENYGSTEGNIGILNIDNTPGACGFVSVIAPALMTTKFIKVDTVTGDLLRGENEVEATMSKILGLRDVVVYGVQVPGTEGRAGMATIVDSESDIDLSRLVQGLNEQLPHYAHPRFLRIVDSVAITGTFKFQKNKLREEGFDVRKIQDKLLYYDVKDGQYLSLHEDTFAKINHGKIRM